MSLDRIKAAVGKIDRALLLIEKRAEVGAFDRDSERELRLRRERELRDQHEQRQQRERDLRKKREADLLERRERDIGVRQSRVDHWEARYKQQNGQFLAYRERHTELMAQRLATIERLRADLRGRTEQRDRLIEEMKQAATARGPANEDLRLAHAQLERRHAELRERAGEAMQRLDAIIASAEGGAPRQPGAE